MGVGRFSTPLRAVGVLGMPDAALDTTLLLESVFMVPQGGGVLQQLVPGVAVGVIIDCRCVTEWVEVTR
jgi:hypothetical protein